MTYRYSGHSPSDASSYRSKEEVEAWQENDSIIWFGKELVKSGVATEAQLDTIKANTTELISWGVKLSIDEEVSPLMDIEKHPELLGEMMFSSGSSDKMEDRAPDVNHPMEENPRVKQLAKKERFCF